MNLCRDHINLCINSFILREYNGTLSRGPGGRLVHTGHKSVVFGSKTAVSATLDYQPHFCDRGCLCQDYMTESI